MRLQDESHEVLREGEERECRESNQEAESQFSTGSRDLDYLKAWLLQLAVVSNHQNGRDTHVRQIKVFGPRQGGVKAIGHDIAFTSAEFGPYTVVR